MNNRDFPGARWWKFDFHTHTPASNDFAIKNEITPELWLRKFMEEGIDCVAITDHNGGGWIDRLKTELEELKQNKPSWYRPLYLFPGVEISTSNDAHILAIFGCEKSQSDIDGLLAVVRYPSNERGTTNALTDAAITEVVDEIARQGGIPIPAHASNPKGLFDVPPQTLAQVLDNENIYSMEFLRNSPDKPQLYNERKLNWTEVQGSDTHFSNHDGFGRFTWVKMDTPSIDGLKLALRDGSVSVNRNMQSDPNQTPENLIEHLEIDKARYIGHSKPLICRFSPFLNTIIGGRGTGKSTLIEFMRLALDRKDHLQQSLKQEYQQYFTVADESLLIDESKISLIYRKGDVRYRLSWQHNVDCPSIEEEHNGTWSRSSGTIESRFPVHIYSQKEIFEITKNPRALIRIIDEAPEVDSVTIEAERNNLVNQYKQIYGKQQECRQKIAEKDELVGRASDLQRHIERIEKSGHEVVLRIYSNRQQQLHEFERLETKWDEMSTSLIEVRDNIEPVPIDEKKFDEHPEILSNLKTANERWKDISGTLSNLMTEAQSIIDYWKTEKDTSHWMRVLKEDMFKYESLSDELEQQGIDPRKYPQLLEQQKNVKNELDLIGDYEVRVTKLEEEKQDILARVEENRRILSDQRKLFLNGVLQDNPSININVKSMGADWDCVEEEIRDILLCPDHFEKDFEALKTAYHQNAKCKIQSLKKTVQGILSGEVDAKDARFRNHLNSLRQEPWIDLLLWFPSDDLAITFDSGRRRLDQGSPGQKNAALLAFILSYGDEPLLLDQPEDDLDNELIYNLIVKQLRETKNKRQVIIVTHNANIVVNGDAELVLPLEISSGETRVRHPASIQEKKVRQEICNILEGGQQAFEQRYKRIHLED